MIAIAEVDAGTPLLERLAAVPLAGWLTLAGAVLASLLAHAVVFWILRRFAHRLDTAIDDAFVRRLNRPALLILPLLAVQLVLPSMPELAGSEVVRHLISLATILAGVWLVAALIQGAADLIKSHYDVTVSDNYAARRMHTQVSVISRTLLVAVAVIGIGLALITFPRVRELGASLLASAGIAGIIIGLAARPLLENMIAGVQLALTQPINIDDVVVVDDEWGRIEEITATYVVVRVWDDRRLICPFTKFITESFENWTRRTAELLGTVVVYADYTVPVEKVRQELTRIVESHKRWDRRVCVLQVTDATDSTIQLRALLSASNASDVWELRVHVREKLIEFLQREYPGSLPRTRVAIEERES